MVYRSSSIQDLRGNVFGATICKNTLFTFCKITNTFIKQISLIKYKRGELLLIISRIILLYYCKCCNSIGYSTCLYLTIRLRARDFYAVIVDEGEARTSRFVYEHVILANFNYCRQTNDSACVQNIVFFVRSIKIAANLNETKSLN